MPSLNQIKKLTKDNQLQLEKINSYSEDYAKTLLTWKNNFSKPGTILLPLDLVSLLKECGNFIYHIVKQDLKQKI